VSGGGIGGDGGDGDNAPPPLHCFPSYLTYRLCSCLGFINLCRYLVEYFRIFHSRRRYHRPAVRRNCRRTSASGEVAPLPVEVQSSSGYTHYFHGHAGRIAPEIYLSRERSPRSIRYTSVPDSARSLLYACKAQSQIQVECTLAE